MDVDLRGGGIFVPHPQRDDRRVDAGAEPLCDRIRDGINAMLDAGEPRSVAVEHVQGNRKPLRFEVLFLPVTPPGGAGQWSLTGMFFEDWTG